MTAHHDVLEYWDSPQPKVFRGKVTMTPDHGGQVVHPTMTHFFYMDEKDPSKVKHGHGAVGPRRSADLKSGARSLAKAPTGRKGRPRHRTASMTVKDLRLSDSRLVTNARDLAQTSLEPSVATPIANTRPGAPALPPKEGFLLLEKPRFVASLAAEIELERADFMARSQAPWDLDALRGVATLAAWKTKPGFYLVATEDGMIRRPRNG